MPNYVAGSAIIQAARAALGTPYVWGGNSLVGGVDCSGLVQQVFKQFGISLPRVTYEQIGVGANVNRKNISVGDLIFFDTDRSKQGPDHVGIYMGNGKFIHAPRPGKPVQISSLADSYYNDRLMAVRRVPGVAGQTSGLGAVDPVTYGGTTEEVRKSKDELAESYGFNVAFFNSIPELKRLFGTAVAETWDATLFTAKLKNTKWWKETSDSNRKAQAMEKQDPATYRATLEAARVAAQQLAVQMGAVLSDGALAKLAKNIVHYGWEDAHIQNFLGQYISFNDKHVTGGLAGQAYQQLKTAAYDNGVSLSEQSLKNSAAYVVRGVSNMEKEVGNIRGIAMGAYPAFADQIQAGQTMRQIASPYVQAMAQTLELPDTDLDMYNAKIKAALTRANSQGKPEPMTLTDFVDSLKDTPDWRRTGNAQNSVMAIGHQVLRNMGVAT
jgi:NlpC/P60 family protein